MESSIQHTLPIHHKHTCKYVFKRGKNKGQTCKEKICVHNRRLCAKHAHNILSIYKSDIKKKRNIECNICFGYTDIQEKLKCGHIIHYECICKQAVINSNVHTYTLPYLNMCHSTLPDIVFPHIKCPICGSNVMNKCVRQYWDDTYLNLLYRSAHQRFYITTLNIINIMNEQYYIKWIEFIHCQLINIRDKIDTANNNISLLFTPLFNIFITFIEIDIKNQRVKTTPNINTVNYIIKIMDYIQHLSLHGPVILKVILKTILKDI